MRGVVERSAAVRLRGGRPEVQRAVHRRRRHAHDAGMLRRADHQDAEHGQAGRERDALQARLLPAGALQPVAHLAHDREAAGYHRHIQPAVPLPQVHARCRDASSAVHEARVLRAGAEQDIPLRTRRRGLVVGPALEPESSDLSQTRKHQGEEEARGAAHSRREGLQGARSRDRS